jgi:hypothetical protein
MAKFLTTENAYSEIVNITRKADKELVFISPFIKIPDDLLARFKYLDDKGVKITLVCREKELKDEERNRLSNIDHLELRFLENLHAKCFYNQESMVITSLNLYEQSQRKKREMGVLLTKTEDKEIFSEAHEEANFIVQEAKIANVFNANRGKQSSADVSNKHRSLKTIKKEHTKPEVGFLEYVGEALGLSEKKGYCIRGGERIPFGVSHPFCRKHFKDWAKYENHEYPEHYCHRCGEDHQTSFSNPLCRSCLKKNES